MINMALKLGNPYLVTLESTYHESHNNIVTFNLRPLIMINR